MTGTLTPLEITVDVTGAVPFDEPVALSVAVHPPAVDHPRGVLVCWPGGSYARQYWDVHVPGRSGYSFAAHMTARGFMVVAADPLGVGQSSRPGDVDRVTLETMAAAAAELVRRLRAGQLDARVPPVGDIPLVGAGHSLGGCLAIVEQALHSSYDAVVNLGYTHGAKDSIEGLSTGDGDALAEAVTQAKAFMADDWDLGYALAPRAINHGWLHESDVPADVIAADDAEASAWPRQSYVGALLRGHSAAYAARVSCPVLVAFGERDVPVHPHDDAGFYAASPDVTLLVLAGSAHCHNLAGTRTLLWDRLAAWVGSLTSALPATT